MKAHRGMRPHDLAVLLKIVRKGTSEWAMKDLAYELGISSSEISESINRSRIAGLISVNKQTVHGLALFDFLRSGLQYVYPQQPGAITRGIPTAHSAPPLKDRILGEESFVWAFPKGNTRGQVIEPLHPKIPDACLRDEKFYELIALCDAIRAGKARERQMAVDYIKDRIENFMKIKL
jgi:predicted transcriptional regulator